MGISYQEHESRTIENGEEEEWLSKIAKIMVDSRMEGVAMLFLDTIGPTSHVWSQLARLYLQPLFILIGPDSEKLLAFAEKPENVEKLSKKIEEYRILKEKAKARKHDADKQTPREKE